MEEQAPNVNLRKPILVSAGIIAAMLIASLWAALTLPQGERFPVHWNAAGLPDRFGSKWETLGMAPLVAAVLAVLFAVIPRVEPRAGHLRRSMKAYRATWIGALLLLLAIHGALIVAAFGRSFSMPAVTGIVLGLLFVVMGNYMGKIRSNYFFGVRTPWTLSSELSWNKTHRLSGRLMVLFGALVLAAGLSGSPRVLLAVLVVGTALLVVGVCVYSYVVWRSDPDRPGQ